MLQERAFMLMPSRLRASIAESKLNVPDRTAVNTPSCLPTPEETQFDSQAMLYHNCILVSIMGENGGFSAYLTVSTLALM